MHKVRGTELLGDSGIKIILKELLPPRPLGWYGVPAYAHLGAFCLLGKWEGLDTMTEEQIKFICKWLIENSSREFTDLQKETLKRAVDSSKNWEELLLVAAASRGM